MISVALPTGICHAAVRARLFLETAAVPEPTTWIVLQCGMAAMPSRREIAVVQPDVFGTRQRIATSGTLFVERAMMFISSFLHKSS